MRKLLLILLLPLYSQGQSVAVGEAKYSTFLLNKIISGYRPSSEDIITQIKNNGRVICYGYADTFRKTSNKWLKVVYDGRSGIVPIEAIDFKEKEKAVMASFHEVDQWSLYNAAFALYRQYISEDSLKVEQAIQREKERKARANRTATAPDRLGNFIVGITTLSEFKKELDANYLLFESHANSISSLEDYKSHSIYAGEETSWPLKQFFRLEDDPTDTSSFYNLYAPMVEDAVVYFAPQMEVQGFYANNVFFKFYKDILVEIEYASSLNLLKILIEKYEGQAVDQKDKSEVSKCKLLYKGKRFINKSSSFGLIDSEYDVLSTIETHTGVNSDCDNYGYLKVTTRSTEMFLTMLKERSAAMKARKKKLIEEAKALKQRQLNSF